MTQSSLASEFINVGKGYYPRYYDITRVTIHHMAGVMGAADCARYHRDSGVSASANYYIGNDGTIVCGLQEENAPWTSSDWDNDNRAITMEVSNSYAGGNWPISDAAWNSMIKLCADICKRYGITPTYTGWTDGSFTEHRMFAATACVPIDSEVLTKDGWVKLADVSVGDEIACASLDGLAISYEPVEALVPVKQQDTYTNHGLTATKDHRIVFCGQYNKNYTIDFYNNVLKKNETSQVYVPLAGVSKEEGLELSDDMIRFYIAVQADGHYMYETNAAGVKSYYGVDFHFAKERKVERIKEILEAIHLDYSVNEKSDGTVAIRVYNQDGIDIVEDICEKHLSGKCFTWEWLGLSQEQSELFFEELMLWDGCESGKYYSSRVPENLDIVNAIAATHNVGSRVVGEKVMFRDTPYNTLSSKTKRNGKGVKANAAKTTVSCVTVKTGIFLIRQNGKTFIIGNCPGEYIHSRMDQIVRDVKTAMNGGSDLSWPVQTYECNTTNAQKWKLNKQSDGSYEIVSVANGMALDVYGAGKDNYTTVQAYKRNNTAAQRWKLERAVWAPGKSCKYSPADFAPYTLSPLCAPNMKLDVYGAVKDNGGKIQLYEPNFTNAQNWAIVDNGDGTWTFVNVASGKALDLVGAGK